jgi:FkbM family methyltransferase
MPKSRLRQLLKFIKVFGIGGGVRLWLSLLMQAGRTSGTLQLNLPGLAAPLRLRERDLPIFWQIMVMKENDFASLTQATEVRSVYNQILSEGNKPVIVDCGGHIGLSAVWFASRYPEATLYCIEPDSTNFSLMQQNTAPYKNVTPINGGIWNRPCYLKISNPSSGSASFRLEEVLEPAESERSSLLRAYTITEVSSREPQNRLFLVKMDIEGAESHVFETRAEWLNEAAVVIIELHDWLMPGQRTSKNFFKRLSEHDFDVVLQGENLLLFKIPPPTDADGSLPHNSAVAVDA